VTCPEPIAAARDVPEEVYDAEIVEAEVVPPPLARAGAKSAADAPRPALPPRAAAPPAANPFDDDDPYPLAGPDPAASSLPEAKKPCPMCGEMILASAVKCRFCGEVFDARLKKGKKKSRESSSGGGSSSTGARDIGIGVLCMGLGIGLTIATFAASSGDEKGGGRFVVFYGLVIGGFAQMCRGIYGLITQR
jgi:hypothetical protein